MTTPTFKVSDFLAVVNQTLDYAFGVVEVVGEVSSFKVNQQKYVFFDLKDELGTVGCFMMVYQLRAQLQDGMKVAVRAQPKVTGKGKFSLTVQSIRLVGEGSIKKNFELMKLKLEKEGLFDSERKRTLPVMPTHVGVITSTQAAGYGDFVKIVNDRWGGLRLDVAHVQVQGDVAPDQIIRAIKYFNTAKEIPEVMVIIRGGGSADDLAVFNDELLVREVAASRVPTLVGVGHEEDVTLADLAADVRAATPTDAAQILVPDKRQIAEEVNYKIGSLASRVVGMVESMKENITGLLEQALAKVQSDVNDKLGRLDVSSQILRSVDPYAVLSRGYAILRGEVSVGSRLEIETKKHIIKAQVEEFHEK